MRYSYAAQRKLDEEYGRVLDRQAEKMEKNLSSKRMFNPTQSDNFKPGDVRADQALQASIAVAGAFYWRDSAEGLEYWECVYQRLKAIADAAQQETRAVSPEYDD